MGVILDSCVWVGLQTGLLDPGDVIRAANNQPVFTSVVTIGELHFGVEVCDDAAERAHRAAWLQRVASRPILDISHLTASAFGILAATVKRTGRSPSAALQRPVDCRAGDRKRLSPADAEPGGFQ